MRTGNWLRRVAPALLLGTALVGGCKKENGIDNNTVIRTPYGVYFANEKGALFNTNNGDLSRLIFPADGYAPRSIVTSGENLIWVKRNTHLSDDNGLNFNPVDTTINKTDPWQPILLDVPSFNNRIYMCTTPFSVPHSIKYSADHGKTWQEDTDWDPAVSNAQVQSLAQLRNGELYAYDYIANALYKKADAVSKWIQVAVITPLPVGGSDYFLGRFNNTLLAIDHSGANGVQYSTDGGLNWAAYSGLPPATALHCATAAYDQTLLVGTDSAGVYRLGAGGTFRPSSNGMSNKTRVYAIVAKADEYKNGTIIQYIYAATSSGLYRSQDAGGNWVMVQPGSLIAAY